MAEPRPRLLVTGPVLGCIERTARDSRAIETGGILMGPASPSPETIMVTHASGPGPAARRSAGTFLRDTQYCRRVLQEHYVQYGVDYIGEWHSHVGPLRRPSLGDVATLAAIMADPDYDFGAFALLLAIVGSAPATEQPPVEILGYVATRSRVFRVRIEVTDDPVK